MVNNMPQYHVKLPTFEGPLDLLLHLINRLEIDIYDIPMVEITEQYMEYVETMQQLQLDVASEYLVMAATLLAIKSRMLLPKQEDVWDEDAFEYEEEIDPREELVARLIEYRKYKEAAGDLKSLEEERNLMFTKPPCDLSDYAKENVPDLDLNVNVYDMIGAFQKLLRRKRLQSPLKTTVARQEISIEERMEEIITELRTFSRRVSFYELFPTVNREYLVATFLAILELLKRDAIVLEQEHNFAEIFVEAKRGVIQFE